MVGATGGGGAVSQVSWLFLMRTHIGSGLPILLCLPAPGPPLHTPCISSDAVSFLGGSNPCQTNTTCFIPYQDKLFGACICVRQEERKQEGLFHQSILNILFPLSPSQPTVTVLIFNLEIETDGYSK